MTSTDGRTDTFKLVTIAPAPTLDPKTGETVYVYFEVQASEITASHLESLQGRDLEINGPAADDLNKRVEKDSPYGDLTRRKYMIEHLGMLRREIERYVRDLREEEKAEKTLKLAAKHRRAELKLARDEAKGRARYAAIKAEAAKRKERPDDHEL